MEIVVTKTAIEETDPVTARVKAARINRQLEELTDSALAFGYEYDEDELKAYYELTGDEETVDQLLAMLDDPRHERRKIWTAYTFLTWHEQFFEKFDA